MRRTAARAAAVFVATSLAQAVTRADIPPPPGYVERCTVELQRKSGEECFAFRAGYNSPRGWSDPLASHGFGLRCRSAGGSFWQEVWCRAATPDAKPLPVRWYTRKDGPPLVSDLVGDTPRLEPLERCGPGNQGQGLGVPADARRAPAAAREKDLQVKGPLDERLVAQVLADHADEIRGRYEHRLPDGRARQGSVPVDWKTVALEWRIDEHGRARDAHVDCSATTLDDPHVYASMKARIATWTFPKPGPGETVIVNNRWVLLPPLGEKR